MTCIKTQNEYEKNILTIITFCILQSYSQVGIGTTNPHPSSILDINSATQGLLVPRLTTIERNAISAPANGLMIYNTTISCFEFFNGITWQSLCNTSVEPTISSIPCNAPFTVTPSEMELLVYLITKLYQYHI